MNNSIPPQALRLDVHEALRQRKSIRAFRPDPVPRATLERILAAAARAPSGTNIQPWQVRVLTGAALARLIDAVLAFRTANPGVENWAYPYYPKKWKEPYLARRRKVGWDLYGLLGITRADSEKIAAQHNRNFRFFDAPVGLIFTIDSELERGSWLDYGMFVQSVLLAAQAEGLGTCAQACWVGHADIVASTLGFAANEQLVCGVALGFADADAPVTSCTPSAPHSTNSSSSSRPSRAWGNAEYRRTGAGAQCARLMDSGFRRSDDGVRSRRSGQVADRNPTFRLRRLTTRSIWPVTPANAGVQ